MLSFAPGVTTQNVTINLLNCHHSLSSGFYTFYLNLFSASGATIADNLTQVDVTGNAPAAGTSGLFVKNAVVDASAGTVQVPVLLGGPSGSAQAQPVTVNYTTVKDPRSPGPTPRNQRHPDLPGRCDGQDHQRAHHGAQCGDPELRGDPVLALVERDDRQRHRHGHHERQQRRPRDEPSHSAAPNVVVGAADGYVDLPVTLNVPGINPVTVNYNTSNGSGLSNTVCSGNSTYQGFGTVPVTFLPGVTTQVVRIPLLNCTASDSSGFYTFYLNLFSASGATIADNLTQVDVTGNAPAAGTSGLFVKNAVVDASAGTVQVPVLLGGPSGSAQAQPVTVNYTTVERPGEVGHRLKADQAAP